MALIEKEVVITTKHGRMLSFSACPDKPGAFPGIVLYLDAPGYREELFNMARRIAKHGYFCVLPDLYYRLGTIRFDTPRRNDAMSAVMRAAWTNVTNADVTDDTAGILAFLDAQDKVKPGPMGCVGYCMSGQFVTTVAARFGHRFAASASLYGVRIVTEAEDSPHLLAGNIKGEMYYAFAETDPSVPANVTPDLKAALDKAGVKYELEVLSGTRHGFCFPEREVYSAAASEHVWGKLFELWQRNLT
jgi:carboxymethylenebutenolidase